MASRNSALSAASSWAASSYAAPRSAPPWRVCRSTGARALAPLLLCLGLTHCTGTEVLGSTPSSSCDLASYEGRSPQKIEIATFWSDDAESAAFQVLANVATADKHVVSTTARRNRDHQQTSLQDWLVGDSDPLPDLFQVNGGSDVLQWVDDGPNGVTQICPLTRLDALYDLSNRFFESTITPVSCRGTLYGLPVGVHRANMLFYNRSVFDRLLEAAEAKGIPLRRPEELESIDQLLEQLATIASLEAESEGEAPLLPFAIDENETWTLSILTFENLMTSRGDGIYETVWMAQGAHAEGSGSSEAERAAAEELLRKRLSTVLGDLRALVGFSNFAAAYRDVAASERGEDGLSWRNALKMVAGGKALYTAMGDWGWAQVGAQEQVVSAIPFPGTGHAFIYTPDSFAVPRRATDGAAAHVWLHEVVSDAKAQIDFARVKQSIPALRDLSEAELAGLRSDRLRETYRHFTDCQSGGSCQLLLAVSGLAPSPAADPCFDEVGWLLARTLGSTSPEEREALADGEPRRCPSPLPDDPGAAGEEVVERLLTISQERFAAACR